MKSLIFIAAVFASAAHAAPAANNETPSSLYCDAMVTSYKDVLTLIPGAPKLTEASPSVAPVRDLCNGMDLSMLKSINVKIPDMREFVRCVGTFDGAHLAHTTRQGQSAVYSTSVYMTRRAYAAEACFRPGRPRFMIDIIMQGPEYVMTQTY